MLEDVDILRLSHTCNAMCGILQRYLARYYKGKKPVLQLACGTRSDVFESRLEDAVEFALEQIRKVERDLGRNALYKKNKPPYIRLCRAQIQRDETGTHQLHR